MFDFDNFFKPVPHMDLDLFADLRSYHGIHEGHLFISCREEIILNRYPEIKKLFADESIRSVNVVAHCADQAIPSHDLVEKLQEIKGDLAQHKKFKFVLIAAAPYHWEIEFGNLKNLLYIYYPEYQGIYWPIYKDQVPLKPRPIKKHFLSLNKRADPYRQMLYYMFYENNWLDKSYFTYLGEDYLNGSLYSTERVDKIHNKWILSSFFSDLKQPPEKFRTLDEDKFLQSYKGTWNFYKDLDPSWHIDDRLYQDSFCSVIIETAPQHNIVNLSEKTFRCIAHKHPVLMFSAAGSYKFLQELGIDFGIYDTAIAKWDTGKILDKRFLHFTDFLKNIASLDLKTLEMLTALIDDKTSYLREQYRHVYENMNFRQDAISQEIKDFLPNVPFKR